MLYSAKRRAKAEHVPFTLTLGDIIIPKRCPVLGIPLQPGKGCWTANSPSLDRFIPALGYVPSNIEVISQRANMLKHSASFEEIWALAAWMGRKVGKQAVRKWGQGYVYKQPASRFWWIRYSAQGKDCRMSSKGTQREEAENLLRLLVGGNGKPT